MTQVAARIDAETANDLWYSQLGDDLFYRDFIFQNHLQSARRMAQRMDRFPARDRILERLILEGTFDREESGLQNDAEENAIHHATAMCQRLLMRIEDLEGSVRDSVITRGRDLLIVIFQLHRVKQEAAALKEGKERLWEELVKLDHCVMDGQEGVSQEIREVSEEIERSRCVCSSVPASTSTPALASPSLPVPGADGIWDPYLHRVNSDMEADWSDDNYEGGPILSVEDLRALAHHHACEEEEEVATLVGEE